MNKLFRVISASLLLFAIASCGGDSENFPMKKRYWTPEDYRTANSELTDLKYNNKELPNLDNPKTAAIFSKIADTTNFTVVANDEQLGLKHRSEFMSDMFKEYRELVSAYSIIDRKDKYQYPMEFVQIIKFGLPLMVHYTQTNNEYIQKGADNPNAPDVVNIVRQNQAILLKNYDIYLDEINFEDRFTDAALKSFSEGIHAYFPIVINNVAPNADFSDMQTKIGNMLNKSKNPDVIAELQNIQNILKSKMAQPVKTQ